MANIPTYSNVAITAGAGLTYSTGTTATWVSEPFYPKQPKVKITDSDIELDGLSLSESMRAIQAELMIPERLNRNEKLEQEFAELKESAERYYKLERKFLEQKRMWNTLKNTDQ
jgi:hypothetical protein